jgi:hypothetical protein
MAEATLKHANGNLGRAIDYFLKHGASWKNFNESKSPKLK